MPRCECGCGEETKGKTSRFLRGHCMRMADAQPTHVYSPSADEIPSGLCECGCGGATPIAKLTVRSRRWFRGHPTPCIAGHPHKRFGPDNPRFTGRRKNSGYVYVYRPEHPRAQGGRGNAAGYIGEHRVVWEEANGRLLRDNEHVHHINGVRDDNRPENLVALTNSEHMKITRANMPERFQQKT